MLNNITINNLPSCLLEHDFKDWVNNYKVILNVLLPNNLEDFDINKMSLDNRIDIENLSIEFSNDIIYKQYGLYDYIDIKNIIKDIYHLDDLLIDELINKIKENGYKSLEKNEYQSIYNILIDFSNKIAIFNNCNENIIFDQLVNLFHCVGPRGSILGDFNKTNNTITVYINSIENFRKVNSISLKEAIEITVIHELFKLSYFKNNKLNKYGYTSEVIVESLASFFTKYYCQCNNINNNIFELWNIYPTFNYPQSGARYLLSSTDFSGEFNKVYNKSLIDMY
jgi:predicted Zn-dependent protease with MMP-like domain